MRSICLSGIAKDCRVPRTGTEPQAQHCYKELASHRGEFRHDMTFKVILAMTFEKDIKPY